MAQNTIGKIPEFTQDESFAGQGPVEEVKQPIVEETPTDEKETPEPPAEKPTEQEIAGEDTQALSQAIEQPIEVPQPTEEQRALTGLQAERVKLLKEISELKGQRREIKQEELRTVEQHIDDLKDLHPEDVSVIERVLRGKGYVTKQEANQMFYESVKQDELNKFLERYPEYKPENDPGDINWTMLQREMSYYKVPPNPHQITEILERSHRSIVKVPSGRAPQTSMQQAKRQLQVASHGSGGAQRPSSHGKLSPQQVDVYRQGGWTEDEIKSIEAKLP